MSAAMAAATRTDANMNSNAAADAIGSVRASGIAGRDIETVLRELSAVMFSSLTRSDQRRTGEEYLHALLRAEGRKSFRNLAALSGTRANPQRLHHFISVSTWDWSTVRRDLTGHLTRELPVRAWVVRPLPSPENGRRWVGADQRRGCADGHPDGARQAFGVWAACAAGAWPLSWRLSPDPAQKAETVEDCIIASVCELLSEHDATPRPVVIDARDADAMRIVRELRSAGAPVLVRVTTSLQLTAAQPLLPGGRVYPLPARRILEIADTRRLEPRCLTTPRHTDAARPGPGIWKSASEVIGTVRVRSSSPREARSGGGGDEFVLLGVGPRRPRWPTETWISDLTDVAPADLYRLARLVRRVDADFARFGDAVGLRDFGGRSAEGWYRHVTLASAAYAVLALSASEG